MKFNLITLKNGITNEIVKAYSLDKKGISEWLQFKNLMTTNEILISFTDIQPWQRAGGETYSAIFEFETNIQFRKVFVKAIVTTNPKKSLIDWTKRRILLKKNNFPVSDWFWTGEATIFEKYYPNNVTSCNPIKLIEISFILDSLGFTTLKFIDDIKCDENNLPFIVDYGFDLGEPSDNISNSSYNYFLTKYPHYKNELDDYYTKKRNS